VEAARVDDAGGMRDELARQPWDAIITDHAMAEFDAPGALRVLHETGLDVPLIVVSADIGEELAVSLMKSGAHGLYFEGQPGAAGARGGAGNPRGPHPARAQGRRECAARE